MQDKDLYQLLMEKLARTKHKKEALASLREEGPVVTTAAANTERCEKDGEAPTEEKDDDQLQRAEREMKEAGLQVFTQAEVRATQGEEWQGCLDALTEEFDSIRTAGVYREISKDQAAKARRSKWFH